jgi:hypothetical protein
MYEVTTGSALPLWPNFSPEAVFSLEGAIDFNSLFLEAVFLLERVRAMW